MQVISITTFTTSVALTIGKTREVPVRHGKEVRHERCLTFGVSMDERICGGSYFAEAFARFKEYLADPKKLEGPSQKPIIREWARPGEYERIHAKQLYKKAKKEIKKGSLSRPEAKSACKKAKAEYTKRKAEAKALSKGENKACA